MAKGSSGPSAQRLWELIEQRIAPGADVARIDERIWNTFGETWAVVFTDLSGFSRATAAFGILHFLAVIHRQRQLLLPVVANHDGLVLKEEADSFLIIFRKPDAALTCAIAMQHACQQASAELADEDKVLLCLGIGYGEVLRVGDHDVWGKEVNAASKLGEDTAEPHEILVTEALREAVGEPQGLSFEPLDRQILGTVKNYRVGYEGWDVSDAP
jgi:adenylate cyclase